MSRMLRSVFWVNRRPRPRFAQPGLVRLAADDGPSDLKPSYPATSTPPAPSIAPELIVTNPQVAEELAFSNASVSREMRRMSVATIERRGD